MRQYTSPQFDPQDADFKGVASYLRDAAVVRVVFVHGMCTHSEEDWIDDTWNPAIQRSLNAVIGTTESKSHALAPESEYSIVRRSYAIGTKQLDARFVLWSESTAAAKRRLQFDAPPPDGEFRWRRARLNGSIKTKLVNDCLSDPVIYAGESGPGLREMMKTALCEAVDLTYDPNSKGCIEIGSAGALRGPILIVTESLGSKMVIDASLELSERRSGGGFGQRLAFVPQVYMLANQLPLIDLAHPPEVQVELGDGTILPAGDSASRFGALLMANRRVHGLVDPDDQSLRGREAQISIVAFTDPNDLLSYRLPLAKPSGGYAVTNVLVSNAGTLFGAIENPQAAHTTYRANDDVMKLVLCGTRSDDCDALSR